MIDLVALLEAAAYDLSLATAAGAAIPAAPPAPPLHVTAAHVRPVQQLCWQTITGLAMLPNAPQACCLARLVAVLGDGVEVELQRLATLLDGAQQPVDPARCAACHAPLPSGAAVVVDGRCYHPGCVR